MTLGDDGESRGGAISGAAYVVVSRVRSADRANQVGELPCLTAAGSALSPSSEPVTTFRDPVAEERDASANAGRRFLTAI